MRIVHICVQAPYNDYWGYQDNLLPKYQKKLGHEVTVITSNFTHKDGKVIEMPEEDYKKEYTLIDDQKIIRCKYKKFKPYKLSSVIRWFDYYENLKEIEPDFIMVHGLGNLSAVQVAKYVKKINPKCKVIADNHLDYNIGKIKTKFSSKCLRLMYKIFNEKLMCKYYSIVYGVTPWRVQYMQDIFGIPITKSGLLLMGADDEKIDFKNREKIKNQIRENLNLKSSDFVVITGGKIDANKNVDKLMEAVIDLKNENIKLIVFGTPTIDMKERIEQLSNCSSIRNIGWIESDQVYDYFFVSDLAVFPGQHSVLWEQACACGIPGFFKYYEKMDHVCVNGNSRLIDGDCTDDIKKNILDIYNDRTEFEKMKESAECVKTKFWYSKIAEESISI